MSANPCIWALMKINCEFETAYVRDGLSMSTALACYKRVWRLSVQLSLVVTTLIQAGIRGLRWQSRGCRESKTPHDERRHSNVE